MPRSPDYGIKHVTVTIEMADGQKLTIDAEDPVASWNVETPDVRFSTDGIHITRLPFPEAVEFGVKLRPRHTPLQVKWEPASASDQ